MFSEEIEDRTEDDFPGLSTQCTGQRRSLCGFVVLFEAEMVTMPTWCHIALYMPTFAERQDEAEGLMLRLRATWQPNTRCRVSG